MGSFENFAFEVNKEPWTHHVILCRDYTCMIVPRMASFRSFGIPVQRELLPSTMSLHWSRASRSCGGSRNANNPRMASNGDDGGAKGISLTSLERMSPAEAI